MKYVVLCCIFISTIGSVQANEINQVPFSNHETVQNKLNTMNLAPMSDSVANEMRGEASLWLINGAVWTYRMLYTCANTGFCAGAITRSLADRYLDRYPNGNYSGGGSW